MTSRDVLKGIARRAMRERGLLADFSEAALAEAAAIAAAPTDAGAGARDLRALLWASIDNDDSLDLDQLTVARAEGDGSVAVLVAVADVDALVHRGSALDDHARANTTSVYTAAEIYPMLPERLSTDLTSLAERRDRTAIVVELLVGEDGDVRRSAIGRALVRNQAKLAYDSVAAWLDGCAPPPPRVAAVPGMEAQLRLQDRVARAMKALRRRHGALSLETLEARTVFHGESIADLRPEERNRAKDLIEDFMIAANGATARFLEEKGFPALRRVLRTPERWDRIAALARSLGESLPAEPSAEALEGFLLRRQQADPERFPDLSLSVVKLLGSGEYALELPGEASPGHFALAVRDYTHSTAPNRRFPDLVTQRLLKAALAGEPPPYPADELRALARHCTEQEDAAAKVERRVRKSAAALLLARRVGEAFDGIVTGASEKGTFVRISKPAVEGKVLRGFEGLDVGDAVKVRLLHTDVERGFVDFGRVREGT
ncbi:MAG TPA: RNB domain-containing ribonuclease [Anaeromyxobacteraceae bacterium]|nr:RNB domain-containing ribonuclease [Anaeromyxobacteraceae bacterium]